MQISECQQKVVTLHSMNFRRIFFTIIALIAFNGMLHAQYYIQCEDTCNHIHGLDMSHYQGDVWWETVGANSKMYYVYLKASEGGNNIDRRYLENIALARRYGLKVGSYHFYRPRRPQDEQLRNFRTQCRPQDQDLIPMIDIETTGGLGRAELCDSLHKFLRLVEREYRQKPIIYTYESFYNSYLTNELNGYKLFIAKYSSSRPVLRDGKDIFAWQYTSKGRINGVSGYVDKSRLMGRHSMREIRFRH